MILLKGQPQGWPFSFNNLLSNVLGRILGVIAVFNSQQKTGQFFVVGCNLFITFAVRFRKHTISVKFLMANFQ